MCRIAGVISKQDFKQNIVDWATSMTDSMHRGGPDSDGNYISENNQVAFAHRRLSILDLTLAGHQPMFSDDKNIIITFNGEIYNYISIKNKLIQLGYFFKTNTDTEVILYAFEEWGESSFSMFEGMFAFAIHDVLKDKIYIARDRMGIKPLYYFDNKDNFIFGSEIRSFLTLPFTIPENNNWQIYMLIFGYIPEPYSTLKNVFLLPKSSYIIYDLNKNYYFTKSFLPVPKVEFDLKNIFAEINNSLRKSVESHLISDAQVGVFLSGGIDSSLISILASEHKKEELKTLSINFEETDFNETVYQNIIVNKIKSNHTTSIVTKDKFNQSFSEVLNAMDQPSTDGINTYFVSLAAKETGLKVVLSGLGADELLGGYPSFGRAKILEILHHFIPNFIFKLSHLSSDFKVRKISFLSINDDLGKYLFQRGIFSIKDVANLLNITESEVEMCLENLYINYFTQKLSPFDKTVFMETNLYMQNQLLKDSDAMSMWHGLELRVPFLDQSFVNLCSNIDYKNKKGNFPKSLLINSFINELPNEIWNRPKKGFTFPFQIWFKELPLIENYFRSESKNLAIFESFKTDKVHWSRIWAIYLAQNWKK